MLSPGTRWREKLGKSPAEILQWRRFWLKRASANPRIRAGLAEACKHDILYYANLFGFTYDPRRPAGDKIVPFVTYPYQDRAIPFILQCIETGQDLVIEKSRDMGASWMSLLVMEWCWHFHEGMSFLMLSRKEDLVDKSGDLDALFPKIDLLHRMLPEWLVPSGASAERRKLHFGNPGLSSAIDGESSNSAAGVGGRRTAVFLDEFSRMENAEEIMRGTADVTRCRIFNFTPWGAANASYKLAQRARQGQVRSLRLHWSEHPDKSRGLYRYDPKTSRVQVQDDSTEEERERLWRSLWGRDEPPHPYQFVMDGKLRSVWYDYECQRRHNDREVAQMLDIDYAGSAYLYFDKATIVRLQEEYAQDPWWEGDLHYDPDSAEPIRLVPVEKGPIKLWCKLDHDGRPPRAPYGAGADISTGNGATNSCFSIGNRQTGEKVLELATPFLRPEQFAALTVALCRLFRNVDDSTAKLAWERKGPGQTYGKTVIALGFRNLYYKTQESKIYGGEDLATPGWEPSNENKRLLLDAYREALGSRKCLNRSWAALEECTFFVNTAQGTVEHSQAQSGYSELTGENDPSGAKDNHGDRVIADALMWKMCAESEEARGKTRKKESPEPALLSLAWRQEYNRRKECEQEEW